MSSCFLANDTVIIALWELFLGNTYIGPLAHPSCLFITISGTNWHTAHLILSNLEGKSPTSEFHPHFCEEKTSSEQESRVQAHSQQYLSWPTYLQGTQSIYLFCTLVNHPGSLASTHLNLIYFKILCTKYNFFGIVFTSMRQRNSCKQNDTLPVNRKPRKNLPNYVTFSLSLHSF